MNNNGHRGSILKVDTPIVKKEKRIDKIGNPIKYGGKHRISFNPKLEQIIEVPKYLDKSHSKCCQIF